MTAVILSSMSLHFFGTSMADDDSMGVTDDNTFGRFVGTDADVNTSHNTLPFFRFVPSFLPYVVVTCCLFSETLTLFSLETSSGIDEHNEGFFMRLVFVVRAC